MNDDPAVSFAPRTESFRTEGVVAELDHPGEEASRGLVILAHGAGSDRNSVLLRTISAALTARGCTVARIDLPYRQQRPKGPPSPSKAAADREGIRVAVAAIRPLAPAGPLIVGGQSYGGRQASMVVADPSTSSGSERTSHPASERTSHTGSERTSHPASERTSHTGSERTSHPASERATEPLPEPVEGAIDGLLLTSYPLHPPGKPDKLRIEHLPEIMVPTLIIHGRRDSFATSDEIASAATLFAGPVEIIEVEKADHGLKPERSGVGEITATAVELFFLKGQQ